MPLTLGWEQIALRLLLASIASLVIGLNRDERGHPAGMRTTMLVCLAATLAMIQVNLLLPLAGKPPSSFDVMDLMRLPLGILSGIGFIGAGVIVKREGSLVTGVTTAATMWFVTVLGLLFGGGQIRLGSVATLLGIFILWVLKHVEGVIPREHHGSLRMAFDQTDVREEEIRAHFFGAGYGIRRWYVDYGMGSDSVSGPALASLNCELSWREKAARVPQTPEMVAALRTMPGVVSLTWDELRS